MRARWTLMVLTLLTVGLMVAPAQAQTVYNAEMTQGSISSPAPGAYDLVALKGPGKFISASVTKQGGFSDITFVSLEIDGKHVVSSSIAAFRNWALTQSNPYGVVLLQSPGLNLENLTIGFPVPLAYKAELRLSVHVSEAGVVQIIGNVIHGE